MGVVESDHDIKLTMELPGVHEKDIDISVSGYTMTISDKQKSEAEKELKSGFRRERSYGFSAAC